MPADRMMHPRLGHSEKVFSLSWFEKWVWFIYELAADDFGVMRASAVTLQAADDSLAGASARQVDHALGKVVASGLLRQFEHQGRAYVCQRDWQDYQHVEYPRETANPKPPTDVLESFTDATQKLYEKHPGGTKGKRGTVREKQPNDSGVDAGTILPSPPNDLEISATTRARACETAKAKANGLRLTAEGKRPEPRPAPVALGPHKNHVTCGRICVQSFLHDEFCRSLGGDYLAADAKLRNWYCDTLDALADDAVVPDSLRFWRDAFAVWQKPNATDAGPSLAAITAGIQRMCAEKGIA